jgi:hypothetical protein
MNDEGPQAQGQSGAPVRSAKETWFEDWDGYNDWVAQLTSPHLGRPEPPPKYRSVLDRRGGSESMHDPVSHLSEARELILESRRYAARRPLETHQLAICAIGHLELLMTLSPTHAGVLNRLCTNLHVGLRFLRVDPAVHVGYATGAALEIHNLICQLRQAGSLKADGGRTA